MLKSIIKVLYHLHFFRPILSRFMKPEEKRLHFRHSIKKLADVQFKVSFGVMMDHKFYLKDISLGGLAFILDSHEQSQDFTPGSLFEASLNFEEQEFIGKFRIAYTRNGISGCQVMSNRQEYKKFVAEKMADLLVKSEDLNS